MKLGAVLTLVPLLLGAASVWGGSDSPQEYDEGSPGSDEVNATVHYEIIGGETDPDIKRLWSNRRDDVECKHARITGYGGSSPEDHQFSRRGSPERALYEWHLCFAVDSKVYRGWRGFDPGPGAHLTLRCRIDVSQPPSRVYACRTEDLRVERSNYGEYASICNDDDCRSFESDTQYLNWGKTPSLGTQDQIDIAVALIRYLLEHQSYMRGNPTRYFVTVGGHDLPETVATSLSTPTHPLLPGSKYKRASDRVFRVPVDVDSGMVMSIGGFEPKFDGTVALGFSFYCGSLCASGHTAIVRRSPTGWEVLSTEMHWIS